jgi:NAD(P)H-hydrate epimerase
LPASESSLALIRRLEDTNQLIGARAIVDGIFGLGARTDLPDEAVNAIAFAHTARHKHRTPLIALDLPTGIDAASGEAGDGALRADVTLTVGMPKLGMLREPAADFVGELVVLPIGVESPEEFSGPRMVASADVAAVLPGRGAYAHKSSIGAVLIVGGAPNYYGAPRLAAEAAMRSGAGLVGLAIPRSLVGAIATQLPEVVYQLLNESDPRRGAETIRKTLAEERFRALVIGPGLGRDDAARELLAALFGRSGRHGRAPVGFGIPDTAPTISTELNSQTLSDAIVIDADALNWLAEQDEWPAILNGHAAILTPHAGEMARLRGHEVHAVVADPFETARAAAQEWQQFVVLKCGYSCVATPDGRLFVAPRAPRELATAGTGDLLAGLIGGLLAQGLSREDACVAAIYLGGRAGALAAREYGVLSVIARDVIARLPRAIRELTDPDW